MFRRFTTPAPPFTISGVTYDDAAGVAETSTLAFYHTDQHWRALWGSTPMDKIMRGASARMSQGLASDRARTRHIKAVYRATGKVIGYARWILPEDNDSIRWVDAKTREPSVQQAGAFEVAYEAYTEDGRARWMDGEMYKALDTPIREAEIEEMRAHEGPFLVLEYLAVHPDHQRKGVASTLVERGLEQADAVGMKVWVMSTAAAQPLYEKLGFELFRTVETDVTRFGISEPHRKALLMRR
ncbi:hypothetical protein CMUS01_11781 [Colletotrichum musicola]|uniref:N-acetyltransferase domain-containing protein n=1 Tax=Colletotrichum musicola TaxID=2175873 RepID=A0A8H6N3J1_9PEZI|nr:hypothetical protein CMUS01_11781 [Colletotrichum musicola]